MKGKPMPGTMEADFETADGQRLSYRRWGAAGAARGSVIAIHGMGGAAGEFEPLGEAMAAAGYDVMAPNLRGQGLDPDVERRGRYLDTEILMRDIADFVAATDRKNPRQSRFVCGESMGGLLTIRMLADARYSGLFSGAVLLCPVVELARKTPWILRQATRLAALVMPSAVLSPGVFIHGKMGAPPLTNDAAYRTYLEKAPHRVRAFTIGFLARMGVLMETALRKAPDVSQPLLVLAGREDPFIRPDQVKNWFDRTGSGDRKLVVYENSMHLLLHDTDAPRVLEEIRSWMDARIA